MNWTNFTIGLSVVTIVVMGFIVLSPAHASSGCLDKHENVTRFNPTELSDYQKCVHEHYGNEVGTVGKYLWINHEGAYTYIPMKELAGKSEAAVIETVIEYVIKTEIRTITTNIEKLRELAALGAIDADTLKTATDALNAKISSNFTENSDRNNPVNVTRDGTTASTHTVTIDTTLRSVYDAGRYDDIRHIASNAIMQHIANAMEQAYKDGYADGYADGYVAGYNQAVTDQNN